MTTKRVLTKKPIENIWSDYNWSVMYGELKKRSRAFAQDKTSFSICGRKNSI